MVCHEGCTPESNMSHWADPRDQYLLQDLVCNSLGHGSAESKPFSFLFVPKTPKKKHSNPAALSIVSSDSFCCGLIRTILWVE
uniref:Alternative protein KLF11 n=1 Tax=Homo sapiens TaxID=9606 RepID=L8EA48_HUMAN|nr:alternative protein KLF11 [Homo sapiens]